MQSNETQPGILALTFFAASALCVIGLLLTLTGVGAIIGIPAMILGVLVGIGWAIGCIVKVCLAIAGKS